MDIELPPDVEPASCFYKIKTIREFRQPINLCKQLAFIRAKGPPPHKFEVVSFDKMYQEFKVNDNYGIINISDFSILAIVWRRIVKAVKQCSYIYAITVFVNQKEESCWEIHAVVTRDLQPFLEVGSHYTKFM